MSFEVVLWPASLPLPTELARPSSQPGWLWLPQQQRLAPTLPLWSPLSLLTLASGCVSGDVNTCLRTLPRVCPFSAYPVVSFSWAITELMVFGCLPALPLPCDYFRLWHNLPPLLYSTSPIWFLDGRKSLLSGTHKHAALSWPCVVTVQTGHHGKRPLLPPRRAGLPFVSTAPGFTNTHSALLGSLCHLPYSI